MPDDLSIETLFPAILGQKITSLGSRPLQCHFMPQVWVLAVVLQQEEHLLAAISGWNSGIVRIAHISDGFRWSPKMIRLTFQGTFNLSR